MPAFKPVEYQAPSFIRPKKPKVLTAEDLLPWRMFEHFQPPTFIVAKTRALAEKIFEKKNGLSAGYMCRVLIAPDHRIRVLDGGKPNPEIDAGQAVIVPAGPIRRDVSPYRLWAFQAQKPRKCGCGKDRRFFFVIAVDVKTAESRVGRYGQCALCMCETLTFDRYAIETVTGGPP